MINGAWVVKAQHRTMVKNAKSLGNKFHRKWFQENCSSMPSAQNTPFAKHRVLWFCFSLGIRQKKSSFISEPNFLKAKALFITPANSGEHGLPSIQQEELKFFIHQQKMIENTTNIVNHQYNVWELQFCVDSLRHYQCWPNPHAQSHINAQNKQTTHTRTPIGLFANVRERAFSPINCLGDFFEKLRKR